VLAPNADTHVIGIRPGEKLHEWMLTSDEAMQTYELADRYTILPLLEKGKVPTHLGECKKIAHRFIYSSETNTEWLDQQQLELMINA
jgi:UDP-N-acetylglucosamine 4,6-dehydratase